MSESAQRPPPLPASLPAATTACGTAQRGLAEAINAALPQTQCTRCGYPDCRAYADAVATGQAGINQCPPGGAEGIARLAELTGQPRLPLNPEHGVEGPRQRAVIDEAWCIGCTLCLKACPVDSILGGPKQMHTVIDADCTGCELCLPVCPVDCISLVPASGQATGWAAWSPTQATHALQRYQVHQTRLARDAQETRERLAARALRAPPGPINTQTEAAPAQGQAQDKAVVETVNPAAAHPPTTRLPNTTVQASKTDEAQEHKRAVIEAALAKARLRRGA